MILVPTDGSAASRGAIARARQLARASGAELRIFPVLGPVTPALVRRRAEAEALDLVVVARTPRWGGRLRLLGSDAEEVACRAPCSVLVEPSEPAGRERSRQGDGRPRRPAEIRSILAALTASPGNARRTWSCWARGGAGRSRARSWGGWRRSCSGGLRVRS